MAAGRFASKTLSWGDLAPAAGGEVVREARGLRRFALRLGLAGTPFAVNGVVRRRFWVRRHKLWEYARGVACVLAQEEQDALSEAKGSKEGQGSEGHVRLKPDATDSLRAGFKDETSTQRTQRSTESAKESLRVLDFGGAATLPVFYLARRGCELLSLDINAKLTEWTNQVARNGGWKLQGSTYDLTQSPAPAAWGQFDAVISFSVLEHIPKEKQSLVLKRLAELVRPGGVFVLTFDYGPQAPVEAAIRDAAEVERLVAAAGLAFLDGVPFVDTGERFALDKRHPDRRFTFGSLFLRKPL